MTYTERLTDLYSKRISSKSLSVKNDEITLKESTQQDIPFIPSPDNIEQVMDYTNIPQAGGPDLLISMATISQDKKKVVLMEYFDKIFDYAQRMHQTANLYDLDLIKDDKLEIGYKNLLKAFEDFENKISAYLEDSFETDTYERALYIYLMLHSELTLLVKLYRKALV